MPEVPLALASKVYERTRPILDGTITVEGVELTPIVSDPSETFWRQLRFGDFDIAEMSLSSYLIARSQGADMIAIPVFPSRRLFHTEIDCHVGAGINGPSDLAGKRLGVGDYQQTAALWTRGVLQHDFGVDPSDIEWFMERPAELSHGGATNFSPPPGVTVNEVSQGKSLASMLLARELDAAFVRRARAKHRFHMIERSSRTPTHGDWSTISPLFKDNIAEGRRFFKERGYLPINHTFVIRGDVHRAHPWLAFNLYRAFVEAKAHAENRIIESIPLSLVFRYDYLEMTQEIFGPDPFPYGVPANREVLETLVSYSFEQGLIPAAVEIDDMFAASTLDLGGDEET